MKEALAEVGDYKYPSEFFQPVFKHYFRQLIDSNIYEVKFYCGIYIYICVCVCMCVGGVCVCVCYI